MSCCVISKPMRCGLLLIAFAWAAVAQAEEPASITIELIVFEHRATPEATAEPMPGTQSLPAVERALDILPTTREGVPGEPYTRLPTAQLQLRNAWRLLSKANAYRPLLHLAWRQPEQSPAIHLTDIRANATTEPALNGTLAYIPDKPNRVNVDLVYTAAAKHYRLTTTQHLRPNALTYLDHPRFGMLLLITPYTPPPAVAVPPMVPMTSPAR